MEYLLSRHSRAKTFRTSSPFSCSSFFTTRWLHPSFRGLQWWNQAVQSIRRTPWGTRFLRSRGASQERPRHRTFHRLWRHRKFCTIHHIHGRVDANGGIHFHIGCTGGVNIVCRGHGHVWQDNLKIFLELHGSGVWGLTLTWSKCKAHFTLCKRFLKKSVKTLILAIWQRQFVTGVDAIGWIQMHRLHRLQRHRQQRHQITWTIQLFAEEVDVRALHPLTRISRTQNDAEHRGQLISIPSAKPIFLRASSMKSCQDARF